MTGSLAGSFSEKTRADRWAEVLASPAHREGRDQAGSSGLGWIMGGVQLHVPDCLPPLSQFGDPLGERGAGQSSTHTWESSDRFYSDEEGAPVLGKPGPEQGSPGPRSPLGRSQRQGHRKQPWPLANREVKHLWHLLGCWWGPGAGGPNLGTGKPCVLGGDAKSEMVCQK